VLGRVWGRAAASRAGLNVLVHRVRKALARAGLDGAWIERSAGGGAARFFLPTSSCADSLARPSPLPRTNGRGHSLRTVAGPLLERSY
jgi:hypothetical protein